tara:strand:- start:2672 stop:3586 length:915 start_codon:yes stop_codon:yes gene_type:complete
MQAKQSERLHVARLHESNHFVANRIFCVIGKRNTGKSVVIRNIVYHLSEQIDFAVLVSPTESTRQEFGAFMPQTWIHSNYDADVIQRMIDVQKRATLMGKARRVLLVLDDLLYDNRLFKNEAIKQIYLNGRHLNITLIVSAQYAIAIPPLYRSNTDLVVLLRDTARQNRKKLYDAFCGIFDSFDAFNTVFADLTANYGCIVINNCSKSNSIDDAADPPVMWYRATLGLPRFSLGSRTFWQLHRRYMRVTDPMGRRGDEAPRPNRPFRGAVRLDTDSQVDPSAARGSAAAARVSAAESVVNWSFK